MSHANQTISALLAVALMTAAPALAAPEGWTVDFEAAKKTAQSSGKDLFLEFTGSDWCPPCKALKANIFDKDVFANEAPSTFVLVKLDFPRDKSNQTPAEIAQNNRLSKEYDISGYPTVILADPQGRPYAQMVGFGGGEADAYVENIKKLQQIRARRDAHLARAQSASGVEKAKHLDAAIAGIDPELACTAYEQEIREIIQLDADGAAGLKGKYETVLKAKEIDGKLQSAARSDSPEQAVEAIDKVLTEYKPTGAILQKVLYYKGAYQFQSEGGEESGLKTLQEAVDAVPDSAQAETIRQYRQRLKEGK